MPIDRIGGPHGHHKTPPLPPTTSTPHHRNISGASIQGQGCYVDMGKFYGTNVWPCMDWSQPQGRIDAGKLDSGFLGKFFGQLQSEGVNKIDLSFAQMSDIQRLMGDSSNPPTPLSGTYAATDSFGPIFHTQDSKGQFTQPPYGVFDFSQNPPQEVAPNFLAYMTKYAHDRGIKVDLSMGGACGSGSDMKLPSDPTTSANDLSDFMKNAGIDSVDFDIENRDLFNQNSPSDITTFFNTLHANLSAQGKQSTATLMGGALDDPAYNPITQNLSTSFDDVNLMLYSNTQYYLDAGKNTIWPGVESWIQAVGGDPSKIHIGFYDAIPYEDPKANATQPSPYSIKPGSSRGQAAAQIYQQLCSQLQADGALKPGQSLGQPFFWIDTPGDDKSAQVMQDFYNTLKGISKTPWG